MSALSMRGRFKGRVVVAVAIPYNAGDVMCRKAEQALYRPGRR